MRRRPASSTLFPYTTLFRSGDRQKAMEFFGQALSIGREIADRSGEATTLNSISILHTAELQTHHALVYCQQLVKLMRETGVHSREAMELNSVAKIYGALGDK